jgi:large subunit ribosomal protein L1
MKIDDKLLKRSLDAAIDFSVIKKEKHKDKIRKFDETIDLIINFRDLNMNDPKSRIDKEFLLPNNVISEQKPNICVIATEDILVEAKKLGLDTLDSEGLAALDREEKKYKKKFVKKYDFYIVEDKLMRDVARYLARFLGPVGKMPKPFPTGYGIISNVNDLNTAFDRYKKVIRLQIKKNPMVQIKIGKKSMDKSKLFENFKSIIEHVADLMPHKYNNFNSIYVKSTMGKSIKCDELFLKNIGA